MSPVGADYTISVPMGDATGSGGGIGGADGVPDGTILAKCDVAELIVYNAAVSDSVRKTVEQYLATKYGLPQSTIPTAGLQLWLRADAGVDTLNGTVSRWHDQSGNGNDAIQASASRQPLLVAGRLNGIPVVRFDGVNDKLGFTGTTHMTQFSLFVVLNNHAGTPGNDGNVITFGANGDFAHQWFMGRWSRSAQTALEWRRGDTSGIMPCSPRFGLTTISGGISASSPQALYGTQPCNGTGRSAHMSPVGADQTISVPMGDATGSGGGIGGADGVPDGTLVAKCDVAEVIVYSGAF